jgi:hypothetical protein
MATEPALERAQDESTVARVPTTESRRSSVCASAERGCRAFMPTTRVPAACATNLTRVAVDVAAIGAVRPEGPAGTAVVHEPATKNETVVPGAVTEQIVIGAGRASSIVSFAATDTPDEKAR